MSSRSAAPELTRPPAAAEPPAAATVRRDWMSLVALAILARLLVLAASLAPSGWPADPLAQLGARWVQWDGPHYLTIATSGYSSQGDLRNLIAFFPLYPGLIRALHMVTGLPFEASAMLLSVAGSLAATVVLYEIGRLDGNRRTGYAAATAFTVFPTAFFFVAPYSEGVFCALAFGTVLALRREQYLAAGLLGGLAAATRLTGLALLPMLLVVAWRYRASLRRAAGTLLPGALVVLGFGSYLLTNWLVDRDPLAFIAVQRQHWYHQLAPPWTGLDAALRSIGWRPPWEKFTVGFMEALAGVTAYAVVLGSWLRLRREDVAYAAALTLLVTFLPFWLSIPRYLLGMYPLFLLLGRLRHPVVAIVLVALGLAGQLVFSAAFTSGFWAF